MARDRRGDAGSLAWLARVGRLPIEFVARLSKRILGQDRSVRAVHSPQAAQFWYEWQAKGRFVVISVLTMLAGLWVWLSIAHPNADDIEGALGGLGGSCLLLTPFVGLYLGSEAGRFDRRAFSATRPLSDSDMASAVLKNVTAVVCSCSAVWLLGIVVALAIFCPSAGEWRQLQSAWADGPLSFVQIVAVPTMYFLLRVLCILLGIWTVVALGAALALARSWFVCVGGIGFLGLMVGLVLLTANSSEVAIRFSLAAVCVVCLLGTLTTYAAACRLGVISRRNIINCCALYILLCIVSMSAYTPAREGHLPVLMQVVLVGICAVPFAPLAAAPCALSWNRHR
ncbi:MAG: hypothetical protein ACYC3X_30515 [Pirellulaceae bacterium]